MEPTPKHIAIIPDGNRRWAKESALSAEAGHRQGCETLLNTIIAAKNLGIKTLTIYTFSTENWRRSKEEIEALMILLAHFLKRERARLLKEEIALTTIGDLSPLPDFVKEELSICKELSKSFTKMTLVLAINYGGRDELVRAAKSLALDVQAGKLDPSSIDEKCFSERLDSFPFSEPELLIRTGGEMRLSNFLLWQISYSELYSTPVLWPAFNREALEEAISWYQKRVRRGGA